MDLSTFRSVFNNLVLNRLVFKFVVDDVPKIKFKRPVVRFKWHQVVENPYVLAGNGYITLLKKYIKERGCNSVGNDVYFKILRNAIFNKNFEILDYIFIDLNVDRRIVIKNRSSYDLLYCAALAGHLDVILYLESLFPEEREAGQLAERFDYVNALTWAPLSHNFEVVKYLAPKCAGAHMGGRNCTPFDVAAKIGRVDMIEWMDEHGYGFRSRSNLYESAVRANQVEVLNYLKRVGRDPHVFEGRTKLLDIAAEHCNMEALRWLHSNGVGECSTFAMDQAAFHGDLEIVKWLHENRSEGCTTEAMDSAAFMNRMDILKWLHENRTEGCTIGAIDNASYYGYLDIVQFLILNRTEGCSTEAIDDAAHQGHLELIKFLINNQTEGFTDNALEYSQQNGHLDVYNYLNSLNERQV